jgi:hypothetical protein
MEVTEPKGYLHDLVENKAKTWLLPEWIYRSRYSSAK